ncbi:MAG: TIGR03435 family protein, partial [Terracidiphilus sp.]
MTGRVPIGIQLQQGLLLLLALFISALLFSFAQCQAQSAAATPVWQTEAGGKQEFEVASVRQSLPNSTVRTNFGLDFFEDTGRLNGLFSANTTLKSYIEFAYKIAEYRKQEQMLEKELPSWANAAPFEIEARAEGHPTKDQVRLMMRSLLENRFKLRMRVETRPLPVYALVLVEPGKLGPELRPHDAGTTCVERSQPNLGPTPSGKPPVFCGDTIWREGGRAHARMLNTTMAHIAEMFTEAGVIQGDTDWQLVVDGTGLTGRFDLDLVFRQEANAGVNAGPGSGGQTAIEAMKKQLGLKLVKRTAPVPLYVIDH